MGVNFLGGCKCVRYGKARTPFGECDIHNICFDKTEGKILQLLFLINNFNDQHRDIYEEHHPIEFLKMYSAFIDKQF